MIKRFYILSLLILLKMHGIIANPIDSLKEGDSLTINYYIAHGEFGGTDEGIIIYNKKNSLFAKYIRYNTNRHDYSISLKDDAIIDYYKKVSNNYIVLKDTWNLDSLQISYLREVISDIKNYIPKEGISNASEYYAILSSKEEIVVIDRIGNWNKFLEIKKVLDIEQQPKKL